jgi:hypothetical protein
MNDILFAAFHDELEKLSSIPHALKRSRFMDMSLSQLRGLATKQTPQGVAAGMVLKNRVGKLPGSNASPLGQRIGQRLKQQSFGAPRISPMGAGIPVPVESIPRTGRAKKLLGPRRKIPSVTSALGRLG